MARIVVFGAAGKAGSRIVREAASRGHDAVAIARQPSALSGLPPGVRAAVGDATLAASVTALAPGADVLVTAVGGSDKSVYRRAAQTMGRRADGAYGPSPEGDRYGRRWEPLEGRRQSVRRRAAVAPDLVIEMKAQAEALVVYCGSAGVRWTYVSPPPGNFVPGKRTGHYRTGLDHPVAAADGAFGLSYEDFAVAVVDEIERPRFIGTRFTVGY